MKESKTQSPESNPIPTRRQANLTISFLLIGGGLVLLFENLGYRTYVRWEDLVPYWPFILILLGSENLLSGSRLGRFIAFLIAFGFSAFLVYIFTRGGFIDQLI